MTKMKFVVASLFALGFATSAFASDSGLLENGQAPQAMQQSVATNAYAYAPAVRTTTNANVDRVTADEVSAH